ncbi:PadR family transcriptional regulator [Nocardia panacis]|uniref:PadR family transcriptional regulator n=1 Tax=Nocardia panacis TaxID=2340916 RepID=A0A3A4KGC0_9NOCA|nr:PadR family transcriptional regulator [Nocardia panacis]RJO78354.1 PadR family transcriptional regulator [Nocardia panacis]
MPTMRSTPLALTVLAMLHSKPLHPYGVQRLIKQWGKDQVVNVSQRAALYRTIERLHADGLIAVRETGRDQAYPERTVYELTDAGRSTARIWLDDMLAEPKQEFPPFPAALSHLLMIAPAAALNALRRRASTLAEARAAMDDLLATHNDLPRVSLLEIEYRHVVIAAEERWLHGVIDDLGTGRLTWPTE